MRHPRRAKESVRHSGGGLALADGVHSLTAGDLARLLQVDLKTIHNWVHQGHLYARRTEGRHLRFARVEIVRFLRRTGQVVPALLGRPVPKVLVVGDDRGLLASVLELALGAYEVLVVGLDDHDVGRTEELVQVLRARPETHALSLVGTSRRAARLRAFVDDGGDVALKDGSDRHVAHAARWLTGGAATPPRGAALRPLVPVTVSAAAVRERAVRRVRP